MQIVDVHMSSPFEMRFTIVDGDRATVRMLFPHPDATPVQVAGMIADNVNCYMDDKAAGFPYDYNSETHVAAILRDASRYGCD